MHLELALWLEHDGPWMVLWKMPQQNLLTARSMAMQQKDPYTLSLIGGDIDRVSQPTYEALQKAITNLVIESGARGFKLETDKGTSDATVRKLFVHDVVAP